MRTLPRNIQTAETGGGRPPHSIFLYPAYTVLPLPLMRSPLGYDLVYPLRVILAALFLAAAGTFILAIVPQAAHGFYLFLAFIVVSVVAACVEFAKRAHGQRTGAEVHTAEAGWSFLSYHTQLPPLLCEQVIMPLALIAIGYGIAHSGVSFELGWWLFFSGLSYALMSRWEYRTRMARARVLVNDVTRANIFAATIDRHEAEARKPGRAQKAPQGGTGSADAEPFEATLGRHPRRTSAPAAAPMPDAASWGRNTSSVAPDVMTWFRRRRR